MKFRLVIDVSQVPIEKVLPHISCGNDPWAGLEFDALLTGRDGGDDLHAPRIMLKRQSSSTRALREIISSGSVAFVESHM